MFFNNPSSCSILISYKINASSGQGLFIWIDQWYSSVSFIWRFACMQNTPVCCKISKTKQKRSDWQVETTKTVINRNWPVASLNEKIRKNSSGIKKFQRLKRKRWNLKPDDGFLEAEFAMTRAEVVAQQLNSDPVINRSWVQILVAASFIFSFFPYLPIS